MPPHVEELRGRDQIVSKLIAECLKRPRGRGRDLPVILVLGTRASGKTVLLDEIHRCCSGLRPCVKLDLEEFAPRASNAHETRSRDIALTLANDLSVKVGQFGRLQFSRLALGLVATHNNIDTTRHDQARAVLRGLLRQDRELTKLAGGIIRSLTLKLKIPFGEVVLELELKGIKPTWLTDKLLRRRGYRWYRHALEAWNEVFGDPLDALIKLNSWQWQAEPKERAKVDEVLVAAFLADLRDAFTKGLRATLRTQNCVALIDNADSPAGQAFLKTLVTIRDRHAKTVRDRRVNRKRKECDPLIVVAAGHTRFPAPALGGDILQPREPREASYGDWANARGVGLESWLYRVKLGDLGNPQDDGEAYAVADRYPDAAGVKDVVRFAHRLTHGHLGGFTLVMRAVAAAARESGDVQRVDLRRIHEWQDPDAGPRRTVAGTAIDRLLPSALEQRVRDDLMACAAARDISDNAWRQALGHQSEELDEFCSTSLWVSHTAGERDPMLHPFLRCVLLWALAEHWGVVHEKFRNSYKNDSIQTIYHTLALGEFAPVVEYLDRRFDEPDKRSWLDNVLDRITAAPRRATRADQLPLQQVRHLVDDVALLAEPRRPDAVADINVLAQVVAAEWISADPLGDPHHTLDPPMAIGYRHLADNAFAAGHDPTPLLERARYYEARR